MKNQLDEFVDVLKEHKVYHKIYDHKMYSTLVIDERIELRFDSKGNHVTNSIWE